MLLRFIDNLVSSHRPCHGAMVERVCHVQLYPVSCYKARVYVISNFKDFDAITPNLTHV